MKLFWWKNRPPTTSQGAEDVFLDMLFMGQCRGVKRCPECWRDLNYRRIKGRRSYACVYCRNQVYPTAGTRMHKSVTPISKWLLAYYLLATNPKTTVKSLQEYLGLGYKTAWRIREEVKDDLAEYMPHYRQRRKKTK